MSRLLSYSYVGSLYDSSLPFSDILRPLMNIVFSPAWGIDDVEMRGARQIDERDGRSTQDTCLREGRAEKDASG
jgi:hypothetical protein